MSAGCRAFRPLLATSSFYKKVSGGLIFASQDKNLVKANLLMSEFSGVTLLPLVQKAILSINPCSAVQGQKFYQKSSLTSTTRLSYLFGTLWSFPALCHE
ncbi:hypothetical protein PENSUB_2223 [Penicillium subrubescens]|uniref:Uncharacterized protein n=1 Tax=Penicillium subrubescens TaxID=1316194 RepID=A0A1Q5UI92_9EURO|nr:hypothetical protein PENSUB_2223 [Penicillium subrubescens]